MSFDNPLMWIALAAWAIYVTLIFRVVRSAVRRYRPYRGTAKILAWACFIGPVVAALVFSDAVREASSIPGFGFASMVVVIGLVTAGIALLGSVAEGHEG